MTYHCGTLGLERFGIASDGPRVTCDGCGLVLRIATDRCPPAWLLDGKAPKGWRKSERDGKRHDECPRCKAP